MVVPKYRGKLIDALASFHISVTSCKF